MQAVHKGVINGGVRRQEQNKMFKKPNDWRLHESGNEKGCNKCISWRQIRVHALPKTQVVQHWNMLPEVGCSRFQFALTWITPKQRSLVKHRHHRFSSWTSSKSVAYRTLSVHSMQLYLKQETSSKLKTRLKSWNMRCDSRLRLFKFFA